MHPVFSTRSAWPAYVLAWTGLSVMPGVVLGPGIALGHEVLALVATWGFALVTLPGYYLCRALPLGGGKAERIFGVQVAVMLVWAGFFMLELELLARVLSLWTVWRDLPDVVTARRFELFGVGLVLSLLVLAFHYLLVSVEARGQALEREAQALLARQRAELGALRAQVHPHFLFNSLNTVSALIGYDPKRAREACIELGDYLRRTLGAGERAFVTLREEWELGETYLGVEALRLGERLQVEQELQPAALGSLIPSLLLQPLIENAITHGVARIAEPGVLCIRAHVRGERLLIELENPVAAEAAEPARRGQVAGGLGLTNVRARLFAHYGLEASLRLERTALRFVARLELPLRRALEDAS